MVAMSCAAWAASAPALQLSLDRDLIERALQVARGSDEARARFHDLYIVHLQDPLVEQIEIVSEFRRVVLIAEDHLRAGDWMFARSAARADAALAPWRGVVTLIARLRFNPLNVYVSVPDYAIVLGGGDGALAAVRTERTPLLSESGSKRQTVRVIVGAIIESRFDAGAIAQSTRDVRVVLDGTTVAHAEVDFGRLE
jgi:hypothetical protein